jgi:SAM-dependent methyltransferase
MHGSVGGHLGFRAGSATNARSKSGNARRDLRRSAVGVYDPLDPDRSDLDAYVDMVRESGARSVLDVGCGTRTFACMLARRANHVTAVDPARASLDVARAKPDADGVDWLLGDATTLPALSVDAAFMTANVAQVFLTDEDWAATLQGMRAARGHRACSSSRLAIRPVERGSNGSRN